jgi:hypothetical protein
MMSSSAIDRKFDRAKVTLCAMSLFVAGLAGGGCNGYTPPERPFSHYSDRLLSDQIEFYRPRGLVDLAALGGTAAVMANTPADENLYDNYQERFGDSQELDDLARAFTKLGNGQWMIPALFIGHFAARAYFEGGKDSWMAQWTERSLRAYLVGAAPLLLAQYAGGSRPKERPIGDGDEDDYSSLWIIGSDTNGASGHAFIGAAPFITAAKMTDWIPAKIGWYALSTLPAWSRVHEGAHYPSQVLLGWGLAYLASEAVRRTESDNNFDLAIVPSADGVFISLGWQF